MTGLVGVTVCELGVVDMADLIVASEEVTETSELQAVTTASTRTTPQAAALMAAGSSASQPHAAVTYQQVDLDQYIQARVQSQLSGMLQQQGMGGPWIPYNGQYPVYYSPGPSQGVTPLLIFTLESRMTLKNGL